MDTGAQQDLATRFQAMHTAPELLVLPNAWDVGSAVVFEQAGFPAIGTTSAGIAFSLGSADGERITREELLEVERRIVSRIRVPLSVDIETGYGDTPEAVCATVRTVIAAGAVGLNIEDGVIGEQRELADMQRHCEMLRAVAALKAELGIPFVLNARTDGLWLTAGDERTRVQDAIERGNRYLTAGADCIFVPGMLDSGTVARLVSGLDGPLNVIATPLCPSVGELTAMRVARLSLGSGPVRAAYNSTRNIASELMSHGTLDAMFGDTMSYAEANALFGS